MSSLNVSQDIFWEISKGKIPSTAVQFSVITIDPPINKWVVAGPLGSGLGGTLFPYNITPGPITIVSTSSADTAAGIGARSILVVGGSSPAGLQQLELIALNGTTPVVTAQTFKFINSFTFVFEVGSNEAPVGDISFTRSGVLEHKIRAGTNRDVTASAVIFSDSIAFAFDQSYLATNEALAKFQLRDGAIPNSPFITVDEISLDNSVFTSSFAKAPLRIPPGHIAQTILKVAKPKTVVTLVAHAVFIPTTSL